MNNTKQASGNIAEYRKRFNKAHLECVNCTSALNALAQLIDIPDTTLDLRLDDCGRAGLAKLLSILENAACDALDDMDRAVTGIMEGRNG